MPQPQNIPPLQDQILRRHVAKATIAALLLLLTLWLHLSH